MRTEIFKKLEKPWFYEGTTADGDCNSYSTTEDAPLMYRAKAEGFNCYVDTSVVCTHYDWKSGMKYSWDSEKMVPLIVTPDGKRLRYYDAKQQVAYQEARDAKEES